MNYLNFHSWYDKNLIWQESFGIISYQVCKFKVGSFNYPMSKMTFLAEVLLIIRIAIIVVVVITILVSTNMVDYIIVTILVSSVCTWLQDQRDQIINTIISIIIIIHYHHIFQFVPEDSSIKSILDYKINFNKLDERDTHYMAIGRDITSFFELV